MIDDSAYFKDSVLSIGNKTWVKIMAEANRFVPAGQRRSSAAEVVVHGPSVRRALIQDDDSD